VPTQLRKVDSWRLPAAAAAVVFFDLFLLCSPAAAQEITVPINTTPLQVVHEQAVEPDRYALRTAAIATIAGNVFDTVTTVAGMNSGRVRETNPVLGQHPARVVVFKSLLVIPVLLAEKHLVNTGHPTIARAMGFAVGGFSSTLAIHNIRAAR
jgi:hypothetical protein